MSIQRISNFDLKGYSTLRIGGTGKIKITIPDPQTELQTLFQNPEVQDFRIHILGGGSNSVFADRYFDWVFLELTNIDITILKKEQDSTVVHVGAGANWDDLVAWAVENNLQGIEMLSAIPGTVGGAVVQNIGAYGQTFQHICETIYVFNIQTQDYEEHTAEDARFEYRNSIYKQKDSPYIVYGVDIRLNHEQGIIPPIPQYQGVQEYLDVKEITTPNLLDIRNAITDIRWGKLPKPKELPNCGSFFGNVYIEKEQALGLKEKFPDMPQFNNGEVVKIPTGWLIDSLGLKGYRVGDMGIYENHALVMVNHGEGTYEQLYKLIHHIQKKVFDAYGITLEPEVKIMS